jgi:hypothetical protein
LVALLGDASTLLIAANASQSLCLVRSIFENGSDYPQITKQEQEQQAGAGLIFLPVLAAPAAFL